MEKNKISFYCFCTLFSILYLCVAATSTYHSIHLFELANTFMWSCLLAGTFEIANMAVTVMLLDSSTKKNSKRITPWIMLTFTTFVQILGNIYATTSYMVENSSEGLKLFTDYVLFFLNNPDEKTNIMTVALMIGAGLPLLALGLTGVVVNMIENRSLDNISNETSNVDTVKPDTILKDKTEIYDVEKHEIENPVKEIQDGRNDETEVVKL